MIRYYCEICGKDLRRDFNSRSVDVKTSGYGANADVHFDFCEEHYKELHKMIYEYINSKIHQKSANGNQP